MEIRRVSAQELQDLREHLEISSKSPSGLVWKKKTNRSVVIGQPALSGMSGSYYCGQLWGKHYMTHRVVNFLDTGQWPEEEVDHIDGNTLNNNPTNLRKATRRLNSSKRGKGYYIDRHGSIRAQIKSKGQVWTKTCSSVEEAISWRKTMRDMIHGDIPWSSDYDEDFNKIITS